MPDLAYPQTPPSEPPKDQHREALVRQLERAYQSAELASGRGCLDYLKHVVINCVPPRPFRVVAEPWQWSLGQRLIPAVEAAAQVRQDYKGPKRFWITLPKGHDKTTLIGRLLNWAIAFPRSHLQAYAAAKDRDQAGLLADAMQTEANLNPWLGRRLDFRNWKVMGQHGSRLNILSTDAGGTAGIRGDLVIMDELTQWDDEEFFNQLMMGIDKRPRCVLIIITNAGLKHSFQWERLQAAKKIQEEKGWSENSWYVYEAPFRLAGWMDEASIAQTRKFVPDVLSRMLFENVWADANAGSSYLSREQASACEDPSLPVREKGEPGKSYFAGVDYGASKDRTALCVLHRESDGTVVIDRMDVWQGSKEEHVPIARVEEWIKQTRENFPLDTMVVDRWQLEGVIQKFKGPVPIEVFEPRSSLGNYAMAEAFRGLVVNKKIRWPSNTGGLFVDGRYQTLTDELADVAVKVQGTSYRVFNPKNTHDDRFCAAAMPTLYSLKSPVKKSLHISDLWF